MEGIYEYIGDFDNSDSYRKSGTSYYLYKLNGAWIFGTHLGGSSAMAYSRHGNCPYDALNWQKFSLKTMGWVVIENFDVILYEEPTTTTMEPTTTTTTTSTTTSTTTTTTTTTDAVINCFDGDNGGCSHHCNMFTGDCECPDCWKLGKDQRTCAPSPAKSYLICDSNKIDIGLDKCVADGSKMENMKLGTCQFELNKDSGFYEKSFNFDDCGTKMEFDYEFDKINIKN